MNVIDGADRFFRPNDLKATRRNYRQVQAKRILVAIANALFLVALALGGMWLYRRSREDTRFALSKFEVAGVHHTLRGDLDAILNRYSGANLFRLEIDSLRAELLQLPWAERVAIEKKLPGTLRIEIVERRPAALFLDRGELRYVDAAGVAFARLSPKIGNAELPLISETDQRELPRTTAFLTKVRRETPELFSRISEISAVAPNGFVVFDRDLSSRVFLREADFAEKWTRLYQIVAAENLTRASIEYADLRFDHRVVIKPRHEIERLTAANAAAITNPITN